MTITLTVTADSPAQIAAAWDALDTGPLEVEIVGDEMFLSVDLTARDDPEPEEWSSDEPPAPGPRERVVLRLPEPPAVRGEPSENTSTSTVEPSPPAPVDQVGDSTALLSPAEPATSNPTSTAAPHPAPVDQVDGDDRSPSPSTTPGELVIPPAYPDQRLTDRIVALLDANPELQFNRAGVIDALDIPADRLDSVQPTLSNLRSQGRITRVAPGWYKAPDSDTTTEAPPAGPPSKRDQVLRVLADEPDVVFSPSDIASQLNLELRDVTGVVSQLYREGRIARPARGQYQHLEPTDTTPTGDSPRHRILAWLHEHEAGTATVIANYLGLRIDQANEELAGLLGDRVICLDRNEYRIRANGTTEADRRAAAAAGLSGRLGGGYVSNS